MTTHLSHDTTKIQTTIEQVCRHRKITCLHAIESGSRAWGFASPDSDYDVRLIYCHESSWYVRLFEEKDTFEYIQDDLLAVPFDIGGWDIKKVCHLIYKSNAVIFEWLNSQIVYQQDRQMMAQLQHISQPYFKPIAAFHHYQGMAKTASAALDLSATLKLKKLFYLLRALLACRWIQVYESPPPVLMSEMLGLVPLALQDEILQLIELKQSVDESYLHDLSPTMQKGIQALWQDTQQAEFRPKDKADIAPLNAFYQQIVFNSE